MAGTYGWRTAMKIDVKFEKSEVGDVAALISLIRGHDDPGIVSIDGMARAFKEGRGKIDVRRQFGKHAGIDAQNWAETVVADIKHQIDEYRTTVPKDYDVEY